MNVYKKLQEARVDLQSKPLKKSGRNKFAGFEYFDPKPPAQEYALICGLDSRAINIVFEFCAIPYTFPATPDDGLLAFVPNP